VLSVTGPHAHEEMDVIFFRKQADIDNPSVRKTFWMCTSWQLNPQDVQNACKQAASKNESIYVQFITSSGRPRKGKTVPEGVDTKVCEKATHYSAEPGGPWALLPEGLGPVTGNIQRSAKALVMDDLQIIGNEPLDVCDFLVDSSDPTKQLTCIKFGQGSGHVLAKLATACEPRELPSAEIRTGTMRSTKRLVRARGRLCEPYCVFLSKNEDGQTGTKKKRAAPRITTKKRETENEKTTAGEKRFREESEADEDTASSKFESPPGWS